MDDSKRNEFKKMLGVAFAHSDNLTNGTPIDLARLGSIIKSLQPTFSPLAYGHEKLRPLMEELTDFVKVIKDDSIQPPRYFASLLNAVPTGESTTKPISGQGDRPKKSRAVEKLSDFALIIQKKWLELAHDLAMRENWGDPKDLPLLRSYIRHTFTRLVFEDKVDFSADGKVAAFNTGLVDRRYQPIFALFTENQKGDSQPWFLENFCVAGENFSGKKLVTLFRPLPEAAYYFPRPSDAIYDITAGPPYVDWEHVIEENGDRIPIELLERTTHGFEVKSCEGMNETEIDEYNQSLSAYLKGDLFAYRQLIDAFHRALDLALKKVRWNYKTAIPIYYPTFNKLSMLLPLCLLSDDRVDRALVVEKVASGNYQGHTIYPLTWAYNNARLIARPDSFWLHVDAPDAPDALNL